MSDPVLTGNDLLRASDIARLASVTPAAVSNWQKRHASFPQPIVVGEGRFFKRDEVLAWLDTRTKVLTMTFVATYEPLRSNREILEHVLEDVKATSVTAGFLPALRQAQRRMEPGWRLVSLDYQETTGEAFTDGPGGRRKIDGDEAAEAYANGEPAASIALRYGVTREAVYYQIRQRRER